MLKPIRDRLEIKKRSQTRPGTLLKHQIPFKKEVPWNPDTPLALSKQIQSHTVVVVHRVITPGL